MSLAALLFTALFLVLAMAGAWAIAVKTGKHGVIDGVWSFAIGLAGIGLALGTGTEEWRSALAAALVAFWALRLGGHIFTRIAKGGGGDPRYDKLKEEWGSAYPARLFLFLQIQAAAGFVLALAVGLAAQRDGGLDLFDALGVLVFAVAMAGETVADRQLERFKNDPDSKGKVCDIGLWGHTRHPNYFFEWMVWVSFVPIALGNGEFLGWPVLVLLAPAMMYWLLVYASGIPPLEAHMLRSRGDAFRAYQRDVNAFWPSLTGRRSHTASESKT